MPSRLRLAFMMGVAAVWGAGSAAAQEGPAVTGTVRIGLSTGLLSGDVCLNRLPAADTITVVLNRSLAIVGARGATPLPQLAEDEPGGEAVRHTMVRRADAGADIAAAVCIAYAGREEVHDIRSGRYREDDSSRVLAFNGATVRARGAARWYPALFDPATGLAAEAESFRVTIECDECARLFMNGSSPVAGPVATFESEVPRELLLFAGGFAVTKIGDGMLLGEAPAPETAARFFDWIERIQRFKEGFIGLPFARETVVLRAEPVREPRRGLIWGFYSDPTLTLTGMTVSDFARILDGKPDSTRRSIVGFLAHELAHRYFGWGLGWRSAQRDLFGEPFASYLELKAVRHFVGGDAYRSALRGLASRRTREEEEPRLDEATAADLSRDGYRYGYVTSRIFALEAVVGEPMMRRLLGAMLAAPEAERAFADYDFIRRTALAVGITPEEWREWEASCVSDAAIGDRCTALLSR